MSIAMRWSLFVAAETSLFLFLLIFGLSFTDSVALHRIQLIILAILGTAGWAVVLARPRILPTVLVIAPLPLLGSLVLTTLTSRYPGLSAFATWQCAAYLGIAWLLAIQAGNPLGRRNLIAMMGIIATIAIVVYVAQVAIAWREWLALGFPLKSVPLRPFYSGGVLRIPAWMADVLVLCIPVVAITLWRRGIRILAVAMVVGGITAIVLSGTRSVLLLVGAVSVLAAIPLLVKRGSRRTKGILAASLVLLVGLGLAVVVSASRDFDLGRSSSYASAIDRFASSPWVGTGPGTYGVGRMSDPVDHLWNLAQPDSLNVVLTAASDSGLVGLVGLAASVAIYVIAVRSSWRTRLGGRETQVAALLGVLVVAGHAMGEVVFALIGLVMLFIAAISLVTTGTTSGEAHDETRLRWVTAVLVLGLLAGISSAAGVVRSEVSLDAIERAENPSTPAGEALVAAGQATDWTPDSVPAWWVRMTTADAAGDLAQAVVAAKEIVRLEGFGQEWLSLGILEARSGDVAAGRAAIDHAAALLPADPVVALNATIYYQAAGAADAAVAAAEQLIIERPDIQPILRANLPALSEVLSAARSRATAARMAAGDVSAAVSIAVFGDDRSSADSLTDQLAAKDPAAADEWKTIVAAWFGDRAARGKQDSLSLAQPTLDRLAWSWGLNVHDCDSRGTSRWDRALLITWANQPSWVISIGSAPSFQVPTLPARYPGVVWRMDHPKRPYVTGIWTFGLGRPACVDSVGN